MVAFDASSTRLAGEADSLQPSRAEQRAYRSRQAEVTFLNTLGREVCPASARLGARRRRSPELSTGKARN
jgi:hypothetical protein